MGQVRLYGEMERGGGAEERRAPRASTREQECRQKAVSSGLKNAGRHPESRSGLATVRGWNRAHRLIIWACLPGPDTKKTHMQGNACQRIEELKTTAGRAVSYAPSTHTRSKYHQPHRSGGQTFLRDVGNQERALVNSLPEVWRRPPDGRQVTRRCWRGAAD